MAAKSEHRYFRNFFSSEHLKSVPFKRLWLQLIAVFFLFSVVGFVVDLVYAKGQMQYAAVLAIATISGLNAVLWVYVLARLSKAFIAPMIVLQFLLGPIDTIVSNWMVGAFHLQPVSLDKGIDFAAIGITSVLILSYIFSISYLRGVGRESFRMHTELAQAQEFAEAG